MNNFIAIGNLTKDVELRATQTGQSIANDTLAVQRMFKNQDGTYDTDFINIVAYGSTAEFLSNYCKKGSKIAIQGEWRVRKYQNKDNKTIVINECLVNSVQNLTPKEVIEATKNVVKEDNNNPFETFTKDDLPF